MMKNGNAAVAATILNAVLLLGCFIATSVHCGRVPTAADVAGEPGAEELALPGPRPFCYKACGNGRCDFCCRSQYTPTLCWDSEALCNKECHPPATSPPRV